MKRMTLFSKFGNYAPFVGEHVNIVIFKWQVGLC